MDPVDNHNLDSDGDVSMDSENREDNSDSDAIPPQFLDFDPCGYDTDLHGHFLISSSPNPDENNTDADGDSPM